MLIFLAGIANNNVATSYRGTVHFTSTDTAAVLPANYTFVAGDAGVHTFNVTLKTAGSRTVTATDTGTATITPKGLPEMHFTFLVVDCGKQLLAVETDANTIVSGTLVKRDEDQDRDERQD